MLTENSDIVNRIGLQVAVIDMIIFRIVRTIDIPKTNVLYY